MKNFKSDLGLTELHSMIAEIQITLSPLRGDIRESSKIQSPAYINRLHEGDEVKVNVSSSVLLE